MIKKSIVITGCSSGIGKDSALALQKRGYQVIACARNINDIAALAEHGILTLRMDMNDSASIKTAFQQIVTLTSNKLDVLINNAGYGQTGALEDIERQFLREQFETNVFGLCELTKLVIPIMRRQGYGRIINVSSILGLVALPFRGAYNASKFAVEGISDTLRLELAPANIQVITIQPGPIHSRFRQNAVDKSLKNIDISNSAFKIQYERMLKYFQQQKEESVFTCTTAAVIKKLVHAIEAKNPRPQYRVTAPAHLLFVMKRLLPTRLFDKFLRRISQKELEPK